jgi:hypothetical protein
MLYPHTARKKASEVTKIEVTKSKNQHFIDIPS